MKYFFILLLSLFKLFLFNCIPEYNCPKNRGKCINNKCECFEEFWTLKSEEYNHTNFIYCNYERRNRFSLLALEFFIPIGISHILRGRKILFFTKIFFLCSPLILLYIGFRIFKNDNIKENTNNINDEEETNLINKPKNKDKIIEINNEDNKDNKNDSYNSEEGNDNENLSGIHTANLKLIPLSCANSFLLLLEGFFILCYFIQHIIDLIGYGLGFYRDKGNVPFL